jgi:hypothetical protein
MTSQLTDSIRIAELDLRAFETDVSEQVALKRLGAEDPRHPLLMTYWGLRAMAGLAGILTGWVLATPLLSEAATDFVAASPIAAFLPIALLVATLCFAMASMAMRQVAVTRGVDSPLLPGEQKEHLKRVHRVQMLSAERRVRDRGMTLPPAEVRVQVPPRRD